MIILSPTITFSFRPCQWFPWQCQFLKIIPNYVFDSKQCYVPQLFRDMFFSLSLTVDILSLSGFLRKSQTLRLPSLRCFSNSKYWLGTTLFHSEILTMVWQPYFWLVLTNRHSFQHHLLLKGLLSFFFTSWRCESVIPSNCANPWVLRLSLNSFIFLLANQPNIFWAPLSLLVLWQMWPIVINSF